MRQNEKRKRESASLHLTRLFHKVHNATVTQARARAIRPIRPIRACRVSHHSPKTFQGTETIATSDLPVDLISYQRLSGRHCTIIICYPPSERAARLTRLAITGLPSVCLPRAVDFICARRYLQTHRLLRVPVRFSALAAERSSSMTTGGSRDFFLSIHRGR